MRRLVSTLAAACGAVAVLAWAPAPASAVSLEPIGTYSSPMFISSDPGDADRLFIVRRAGTIALTSGGTTTTFLDIHTLVDTSGERGLLSAAFAPDYVQSHRFYVDYADASGTLHVDEFTASGNTADPATRRPLLSIPHPGASNHNGGQLQFGPDGYLYISTGDGGTGGANAQDITGNLLGKILRIDPRQSGSQAYTHPVSNPFVGVAGDDEIWSYGFRNPWRFSFDRLNGALAIGDVGQSTLEEVDYRPQGVGGGRGEDFGWNVCEGNLAYPSLSGPCTGPYVNPVFVYGHGGNCAITGGFVSRDPGVPELYGRYLYADLCAGQIRSLVPGVPAASDDRSEGLPTVSQVNSFGEDSCGRVYVASLGTGVVSRLVGPTPTQCPPPQSDTQPPSLEAGGHAKQGLAHGRRIELRFTSDEAATLEIGGEVTARPAKRRLFELATKHRHLDPGLRTTVSWKLGKRRARRCRRLFGEGRRLVARFSFSAVDAAGNRSATGKRTVRLKHR
jgi:glucose/arabinose dehydrogenase